MNHDTFFYYFISILFTSLISPCYGGRISCTNYQIDTDEYRKLALINAAYKASDVTNKKWRIINYYEKIESLTEYQQHILLKYRNPEKEHSTETTFYTQLIALKNGQPINTLEEEKEEDDDDDEEDNEPPCNNVCWHVELDEESFEEHHAPRQYEKQETPADYTVDTETLIDSPSPSTASCTHRVPFASHSHPLPRIAISHYNDEINSSQPNLLAHTSLKTPEIDYEEDGEFVPEIP